MSIANEIQRLQNAKANIKSAIEQKGVTVGDGTIDTYAAKISEISGGGESVNPLEYATRVNDTFYDAAFPEGYELTLNVPNITNMQSTFQSASGIEKVILKGNNGGNAVNFANFLRSCGNIKTLDLTEFNAKIGNAQMMLYFARELQEVLGELDFSECTSFNSGFSGLSKLVTFTPKANTIKGSIAFAQSDILSTDTIQSIIDGLATVDTAQTLTLHKDIKLLQSQVDSANAKGWTVAGGTVVSEEEYYA